MPLTHDECLTVKLECEEIVEKFVPSPDYMDVTQFYVVAKYNESEPNHPINGDTYDVISYYDEEHNTQGIDENGIIPEPVEETPAEETEEPTEETPEEPTEEETPAGDDQPQEEATEEQPVEEAPAVEEQPETMAQEIATEEEK